MANAASFPIPSTSQGHSSAPSLQNPYASYPPNTDPTDPYDRTSVGIPLLPPRNRGKYAPLSGEDKGYEGGSTSPFTQPISSYNSPIPPPRRPRRFAIPGCEPPQWSLISLHIILCALSYPVLFGMVQIAKNKTLFWTRTAVSIGCWIVGTFIGWSLLELGRPLVEAATWATIIHLSHAVDSPGLQLSKIAHLSSADDPMIVASLLWRRVRFPHQARRQKYDKRPWFLIVLFFAAVVLASMAIGFGLDRVIEIETNIVHQQEEYSEVMVKGDLSETDIQKAASLVPTFNDFRLTWTLDPFSENGRVVPPASTFQYENDTVYFADPTRLELLPNGTGFGNFDFNTTDEASVDVQALIGNGTDPGEPLDPGQVLRYPRWGIRMHCEKLPQADVNIVPRSESGLTYLFTPRETLQRLFSSFSLDVPTIFSQPLNVSSALQNNDTMPSTVDPNRIVLSAHFSDNGVAMSFKSVPVTMGAEGNGFISIESVLVRLNTEFAPRGKFPLLSGDEETRIGYDAAVCLQLYEPYLVEVYNATVGDPTSFRLVDKGNTITDDTNAQTNERNTEDPLTDPNLRRTLSSKNLEPVYIVLHENSVNRLVKDNGRDSFYVPSPTLVSYTGGKGFDEYTELSAELFAQSRSSADAVNVLPYFYGSADTVARSYPDRILATAGFSNLEVIVFLGAVAVLGILCGFLVPVLPLGVPQRGFDVYSWMAAFQNNELVGQKSFVPRAGKVDVEDLEQEMGEVKYHYNI